MSQEQEYQALARKFVDLWQERIVAMMHDGEFVRMLLKMVQSTPGSGNAASGPQRDFFNASVFTKPSAGGYADAPDARDSALDRLEHRLASIESRIAGIEDGNRSRKPARKQQKRKKLSRPLAKPARRPAASKSSGSRGKKPRR